MKRNDYTYISDDEKRRILELRTQGYSYAAIARLVGRAAGTCRSVVSRRGANANPKLSAAQRAEILRIYHKHPVTQEQLARQFGVARNTISRVLADAYKARLEQPA